MRIAVIGTGIAGLATAWLLDRRHEVHVFEREPRPGGHTNTVGFATTDGRTLPVDTGFIVYNEATYPSFTRLLDEVGVATQPSDMSFGLRCERCDLEYAGSLRGLAAQPGNLLDVRYHRFVADILRFNRLGRRLVGDARTRQVPLGRFLRQAGFGHQFANHYLVPMAAAIWSSGPEVAERFPLDTLLRFFDNHGLLGVTTHHPWRTVTGGAQTYVAKLAAPLGRRLHTGDGVASIRRDDDGIDLRLVSGVRHRFDAVVVATHADEALELLDDPSVAEKELLGAWEYSTNEAWLHSDASLLPRAPAARASWSYLLADCRRPTQAVSLSYDLGRLQSLDTDEDVIVTLNPSTPPRPETVRYRTIYTHPRYTPESVATQDGLAELSGTRNTFYAGAYHRYGFHEDGVVSAVRVAEALGVQWP